MMVVIDVWSIRKGIMVRRRDLLRWVCNVKKADNFKDCYDAL